MVVYFCFFCFSTSSFGSSNVRCYLQGIEQLYHMVAHAAFFAIYVTGVPIDIGRIRKRIIWYDMIGFY